MHRKMRFLSILFIRLLLLQFPIVATTFYETAKVWRKALTGKMLTPAETHIVRGSLVKSALLAGAYLIISSRYKIRRLRRDLRRAIQEQDHELVRQIVPRMWRRRLKKYVWIALYNNNHEALKILLEYGVYPDKWTLRNGTPLCVALVRNDFESAHLLLDHGADPDCWSNIRGFRPLFYAYKDPLIAKKMREKIEMRERQQADRYNKHYCKQPSLKVAA